MNNKCKCCGNSDLKLLIDLGNMPVAHNLLDNYDDVDKIVHPLRLHYCDKCGFIQINDPIDPEKLYSEYNYCFSNWKNEPQMGREIEIIRKWISDKTVRVMEVGCNDGAFIGPMMEAGYKSVIGIEANHFASREAEKTGATIINSFFTKDTVSEIKSSTGEVDLLILRAVLEHLPDLEGFFGAAGSILANNKYLFIEVPDFEIAALRSADCSSIWEEHTNYFTTCSLDYVLRKNGYLPLEWDYFDFSGGTMCVLAQKSDSVNRYITSDISDFSLYESFGSRVQHYAEKLKSVLQSAKEKDYKVYLYGTGCRACTLVNEIRVGKYFDGAIDDQPEKQGKYMPGCRIAISSLQDVMRDTENNKIILLAVNHENEEAVKKKIGAYGCDAVFSLFAPNDVIAEVKKMRDLLEQ